VPVILRLEFRIELRRLTGQLQTISGDAAVRDRRAELSRLIELLRVQPRVFQRCAGSVQRGEWRLAELGWWWVLYEVIVDDRDRAVRVILHRVVSHRPASLTKLLD
jgi:hypothetical protein